MRPDHLFNRLTTIKALAEVHQRLADLMFPADKFSIQQASIDHLGAKLGKRATGDEAEYEQGRSMRSIGGEALVKVKRQVYRHRDILDCNIADGVIEKNLVGIVENCDRAFQLTEEGFNQPIPQHKLKKIQRDALVALSNWVEPAAVEYENRMRGAKSRAADVLNTEGGRKSAGAKQWDEQRHKDVHTGITQAEGAMGLGDFKLALELLTGAKQRGWGDLEGAYSWDPALEKWLNVNLSKALIAVKDLEAAEQEAVAALVADEPADEEQHASNLIAPAEASVVARDQNQRDHEDLARHNAAEQDVAVDPPGVSQQALQPEISFASACTIDDAVILA
jgi:hypothetical protein